MISNVCYSSMAGLLMIRLTMKRRDVVGSFESF